MNSAFDPITWLFNFAFFYPIVMAFFWMIGGLYYYLRRERGTPHYDAPPPMHDMPFVSMLVPCYNEGERIGEDHHRDCGAGLCGF